MRLALILFIAAVAGGCARYEASFFRYAEEVRPARDADSRVELYRGQPDRPHQEIGEIMVLGASFTELEGLREELTKKARAVGADAVKLIRVHPFREEYDYGWYGHFHHGYFGWSYPGYTSGSRAYTMIRGVAIVWK